MKTYNCVHPQCNKKAVTYCGHVVFEHPEKGKQKVTAGLCEAHGFKMLKRIDLPESVEWVEPWRNGKPWRKKNGLVSYSTRIDPITMTPYQIGQTRDGVYNTQKSTK